MLARLLAVPAVLAVLAGGLVLGSLAPAAACSCVTDDPVELADHADVAFVGALSDATDGQDVLWAAALVGVVGALGMVVVRRLTRRTG